MVVLQTAFQRGADGSPQGRVVPWIDVLLSLPVDDITVTLADSSLHGLLDNCDSIVKQVNASTVLDCRLDLGFHRWRIDIRLNDRDIANSLTAISGRNSRRIAIADCDDVLGDRIRVVDKLDVRWGDPRVGDFAQGSIDFPIRLSQFPFINGGRRDIEVPQALFTCLHPESHADIKAVTDDLIHEPSTIVDLALYQ